MKRSRKQTSEVNDGNVEPRFPDRDHRRGARIERLWEGDTTPHRRSLEVVVTKVAQRDVPIYSEAVGTTEGFVKRGAAPRAGPPPSPDVRGRSFGQSGDLLFEIDDREYRAALDEARAKLAREQEALRKYQLDVARYKPLPAKGAVSTGRARQRRSGVSRREGAGRAAAAALETARLNLGWREYTRRSTAWPASRRFRSATRHTETLSTTISQSTRSR